MLLTVMLCSLGLAALAGALAALLVQGEIVSRVISTGVTTALAAGAFLALAFLLNREKFRLGGLLGMSIVLLVCLLTLWLIWAPRPYSYRTEEETSQAIAGLLLFGTPATLFLLFGGPWKRSSATRIALCTYGGSFAVGVIGSFLHYPLAGWLWQSSINLGAYGTLAALSVVGVPTPGWKWRWIGILSAVIAIAAAFSDLFPRGHISSSLVIAGGGAAVVAYANLTLFCALRPGQERLRSVGIGIAILTALLLDLSVFLRYGAYAELFGRAAGAAGVITACGGLAMVILSRLNRRDASAEPEQKLDTSVALSCPHCQTKQTIRTGDSSCVHCGLQFHLEITEPRCPGCGYLLFMLRAARCPECGIELAANATPPATPA
jgi:membrane-associated PAP2 superfamily phosphatase